MKNILKIWIAVIFMVIAFNSFSQNPASASSMESGYWNYEMNQYEADSYSMNKTQTILVHKTDSVWAELDSIWKNLKSRYQTGHHFKTVSTAIGDERYYVYATDSTFEIADMHLPNTDNKVCFIQVSVGEDTTYKINEVYNANVGTYYMSGANSEIICKLMRLLKTASN